MNLRQQPGQGKGEGRVAARKAGRVAVRARQARRPLQSLHARTDPQGDGGRPPRKALGAAPKRAPEEKNCGQPNERLVKRVAAKVADTMNGVKRRKEVKTGKEKEAAADGPQEGRAVGRRKA